MSKNSANNGLLTAYLLFFTFFLPFSAKAQFFSAGSDPAWQRWQEIQTEHFRIIYPAASDSLAHVYGSSLERFYPLEALSSGYSPLEYTTKKLPVVLHPYTPFSNGSVAWAPRRMDLFSMPPATPMSSTSWNEMLAVHELRHVSQMQMGYQGWMNPFRHIFGEGAQGFFTGLYLDSYFMEGDATLSETALTHGGRGRSNEFLGYSLMAFDKGDVRSWQQWLYGSNKHYTPDYYTFGYLTLGSIRSIYGTSDLYSRYSHQSLKASHIDMADYTFKEITGLGNTSPKLWQEIVDFNAEDFRRGAAARGPFMQCDIILSENSKTYTVYEGSVATDDKHLLSVRNSFHRPWELVSIDLETGKEKVLRKFSAYASQLEYYPDSQMLFWSEQHPSVRWSLDGYSAIWRCDLEGKNLVRLTPKDRYIYYPQMMGDKLGAIEHFVDGSSALILLDWDSGSIIESWRAPSGVQALECALGDESYYLLGLADEGYCIYQHIEGNNWEAVTPFITARVYNLMGEESGSLLFTCELNGVSEFYRYYPSDGLCFQLTNSRYGGSDYQLLSDGSIVYSSPEIRGHSIMKVDRENVLCRRVNLRKNYKWTIAENLSRQERALAEASGIEYIQTDADTSFSVAKRHRPRYSFHTWLPIYTDYDEIKDLNISPDFSTISSGAVLFFQSERGSSYGSMGYGLHPDPDIAKDPWRHSLHLRYEHEGIRPSLKLKLDYNDRTATDYWRYLAQTKVEINDKSYNLKAEGISGERLSYRPYLSTSIDLRLKWKFSRQGISSNLFTAASLQLSNDRFDSATRPYRIVLSNENPQDFSKAKIEAVEGHTPSWEYSSSLRLYAGATVSQYTPVAKNYPDYAGSFEAGVFTQPGLSDIYTSLLYGAGSIYIPGPCLSSIKCSVVLQKPIGDSAVYVGPTLSGLLPRGFVKTGARNVFSVDSITGKFSFDWSIPFNLDGWAFRNLLYVTRLNLEPFFDYAFTGDSRKIRSSAAAMLKLDGNTSAGNLCSIGCTFSTDIKRIIIATYDVKIGLSAAYNFGSAFGNNFAGFHFGDRDHFYLAPVLSMDF